MPKLTNKKVEHQHDSFELGTLRMVINKLYPEVTEYEEQARLIFEEFGYRTTGKALWLMDEPTIQEEEQMYYELMKQHGY